MKSSNYVYLIIGVISLIAITLGTLLSVFLTLNESFSNYI